MMRSIGLASLLLSLLGALPAAADPGAESKAGADRCGIKVRLRGPIYDFQNATLLPTLAETLDELAKAFRQNCPDKLLIIEAHAYEMPTADLNLRLSELRAHTIRYELTRRGVPETQTMPAPMGDTRPLVPLGSADSINENRRITFRVAD
jgi:outer membrane protein OmpA-like peptidoglycan-associated protein